MKIRFLSFLNPARIMRARRYRKEQRQYDRSAFDLELYLYSQILKNDMLHYGYFEDTQLAPEEISIADMERAQYHYAQNIMDETGPATTGEILDAGCGMGGLTGLLLSHGYDVEALTPNEHQAAYLKEKYPSIPCHQSKYEDFNGQKIYQTVIHSESLQYIPLKNAFQKTEQLLHKNGRWIITDYFRLNESGINTSGHLLQDFRNAVRDSEFEIVKESDITANVLPTLKLVRFYADRFVLPLKHFGFEKFRFKKPFWYSMAGDLRKSVDQKMEKEMTSIDPVRFVEEKKYFLFILERKS